MLDKTKRYLVVGLGLLGGKYALELTRAGFHVDGINRSEGHLQYALEHGYIAGGKTHDFEDLVRQADHIIFGLYPTALLDWFRTYGSLLKPGCIFTDVSGVKTGLVEPVQALCPAGVEFIASHPMASTPPRSALPQPTSSSPPLKRTPRRASSGQRSLPRCWASSTSAP